MNSTTPYYRLPLEIQGEIPVFSARNQYIANYDQISADHLAFYSEDGSNPFMPDEEIWTEMEMSTAQMVRQYLPANGIILDVGVGMGRLLEHFPDAQRYGMDISIGYLELAQKKGIITCLALIEDMPYCDKIFDVVVCTDVLGHVIDLNSSLKNIFRVLKDDGTLIIRVPYREELKCYLTPGFPYHFVHLRNFDEYSLMILFTKIFNCTVRKMKTAVLYAPAFGTFRGAGLIAKIIRTTTSILPAFLATTLRKLFLKPIEINVAVTKAEFTEKATSDQGENNVN